MEALDNISCLTAANPGTMTLEGTNQYLLGREEITVVDVALASKENIDSILEQMEIMGGKKIEKILLTHIHRDHAGGALALKKRCGGDLGVHRSRAGFLRGEDFLYSDGDRIPYDGGELAVVHTPGHESGHCCFYESKHEVLFSGDHILGRGTTVIPPPDGDMALYLQSLEKLLKFKISCILPGHGPAVQDPYTKIKEYIDHRLMREQEVFESLGNGHHTPASMVSAIYTDTPPFLHSVAQLSVEAHLIKLINEGRVRREGQRYLRIDG
ncbi:MAG: MBL fold metallo-hydrolase [Candidatus Binatia bacterium]